VSDRALVDQAHGALADFGGEFYGFLHGPIFKTRGGSQRLDLPPEGMAKAEKIEPEEAGFFSWTRFDSGNYFLILGVFREG
jgi:hypothetical protein